MLSSVAPIETKLSTLHIEAFEEEDNNEAIRLVLDFIDERRMGALTGLAAQKRKVERYYNSKVKLGDSPMEASFWERSSKTPKWKELESWAPLVRVRIVFARPYTMAPMSSKTCKALRSLTHGMPNTWGKLSLKLASSPYLSYGFYFHFFLFM